MLRRWVDKHGKAFIDGPELRVRHAGAPVVGDDGAVQLVTLDSDGAEVRLPSPILRSVTLAVGTLADNPTGLAQVDVEWDGLTTCVEAVCVLAEPIPERPDIDLVYVLNTGLARRTVVCDARTGERLVVFGVKVQLAAGEQARAWVALSPPAEPNSAPDAEHA